MRILVSYILVTVAMQADFAQAGNADLYEVKSEFVAEVAINTDLYSPSARRCSQNIQHPVFADSVVLFNGGTPALTVDFKSKCVW